MPACVFLEHDMAHDERLAERLRGAIGPLSALGERRMMGGLCFMLNGNMIGGVDRTREGAGRFMFRCGKDNAEAQTLPGGEPMVMGGRMMRGFYFVDADACADALLARWIKVALDHVRSLPPK
ncbi:MAG: TfoX/Sxy family protein [Sphingopyxis sp.]